MGDEQYNELRLVDKDGYVLSVVDLLNSKFEPTITVEDTNGAGLSVVLSPQQVEILRSFLTDSVYQPRD